MLHLGKNAACMEYVQIPSLLSRNISFFRINPSQNLDREAPKWDPSAWKLKACCCHPVENGDLQLLGTTPDVHKTTAGMVVKEICETVITLMRPRGKETREFPLNNFRICKEDVWMLYRNNWWCLCHPHGVPGGWSTSAAEAFKDILGKFLTQAMIEHLLHSGMVECTASPACLARIPLFFPPRLFLHCAFQLLLFHTKKRQRED